MNNKTSESSIQKDLNKAGFGESNDPNNNSNEEIKLSNRLSKTEEINEDQNSSGVYDEDNIQPDNE